MFRKPVFWIVFVLVAAGCVIYAARNFSTAFPVVTLELEMDREQAMAAAAQLAAQRAWGPEDARQAASFDLDSRLQSFVELEGGGRDAFGRMLKEGLVSPYTWQVRSFREFETTETRVSFTPAGEPYGFVEKLPEDQPGAALDAERARQIAEHAATSEWSVDLTQYEPVEQAEEARTGGRVDHTFVYERPNLTVGEEGRYRLRLVVAGDRLTELTRFVKIPQAFDRRFEEMRSANDGIATGSLVLMAVVYGIGGCILGSFLLLRQRFLLWRPPVKWAIVLGLLWIPITLNRWPLAWMGYDTAVSAANFGLQQVLMAVLQAIGMGIMYVVTFTAAESLSRKAFPHHIQFWKVWSPQVAGTRDVAGLTVAGYLLVAVFMAYDVFLYTLANQKLGWWTPAEALIDPDTLATVFPWLNAIGISFHAGFWEETMFRAIPLALAALIGRRLGGRRWWILGALILESVVFGAGHANYAQQPAYARLVELIVPAASWGVIFLAFGLLPVIVLHFVTDVMWFSIPLFTATSPGIWFNRGLLLLLVMVPLWVVLWGRLRTGAWGAVDEGLRNAAWEPPPPVQAVAAAPVPAAAGLAARTRIALLALGAAGLVAWALTAGFNREVPPIEIGRAQAVAAANGLLADHGVELDSSWKTLSTVRGDFGLEDVFVWQEGGPQDYRQLLDTYLGPPEWYVRRATFEGDVVARAEEYDAWVDGDGTVRRYRHRVPDNRPGAQLEEAEARAMAERVLRDGYSLDPATLRQVAAEPTQHPERRDWRFVYSDPAAMPIESGEARIAVVIAGDQVVDSNRFVHIPEDWERTQRNRSASATIVQIVCTVTMVLIFIAGAVAAVVRWSRGRFAVGALAMLFLLMLGLSLVNVANSWRSLVINFSTAQPYALQSALGVAGGVVVLLVMAAGMGLNAGFIHRWLPPQPAGGRGPAVAGGLALGALAAGLVAVAAGLLPALEPPWPSFQGAAASLPLLAAAIGPVRSWITSTTLLLLVLGFVHVASRGWTRARLPLGLALVVLGPVMVGASDVVTVARWLATGLGVGVFLLLAYLVVLRFHLALVPVATAAFTVFGAVHQGILRAYPGALVGAILAAAMLLGLAVLWLGRLTADTGGAPEDASP